MNRCLLAVCGWLLVPALVAAQPAAPTTTPPNPAPPAAAPLKPATSAPTVSAPTAEPVNAQAADAAPAPAPAPPAATPPSRVKRLIPDDPKKVYLFFDQVAVQGEEAAGREALASVLTSLARARINVLESVRLKTFEEMPEVPEVMTRFGELEKLDRVSLIAIKNLTGFDGLIRTSYSRGEGEEIRLVMTCFDFRNGQIFRKRELKGPIGAELFRVIEGDLTEFATTVRRSYRVTLNLRSNPEGSTVLINNRAVGTTPMIHELSSGEYRVRIEKPGFKEFEERYQLSDGDRLHLDATLYNPLAARFLNAQPGFRVDSRQFETGYRYVYLDLDRPGVDAAHLFVLSGLLRFLSWDVGLQWASSGMVGENRLDTFLGEAEGLQRYDILLQQFQAIVRYALLEKYSFAALNVGASSGLTFAATDDGDQELSRWSYSGALFLELVSRLFRAGNFSMELQFTLGLAYLGQVPYTERTFTVFGAGPAEEKERAMLGPMGSLALRLVFWNDIF